MILIKNARFNAILKVGQANDRREIQKRSLHRLHSMIARDAMEELSRSCSQHDRMTLPEQISRDSNGIQSLRDLPVPVSTLQRVTGKNLSSIPQDE